MKRTHRPYLGPPRRIARRPIGRAATEELLAPAARATAPLSPPPPPAPEGGAPADPGLMEQVRSQWLEGDWAALNRLDSLALAHHPDRAKLSALTAAAALQLGDRIAGTARARRAVWWGASRALMGSVLLAAARETLGRACFVAGREHAAERHFEAALGMTRLSSEARRRGHDRLDRLATQLRAAVGAEAARRRGPDAPGGKAPDWLARLAQRCLNAPDLHLAVDDALAVDLGMPEHRLHLLMLLGEAFLARGDKLTAVHFLRQAVPLAPEVEPGLRSALVRKLLAAGSPESAIDLMIDTALAENLGADAGGAAGKAAQGAYQKMRSLAQARIEHGHDLLLAYLERQLAADKDKAGGRKLVLIEVGSTREDVPGQGSTAKIARFCKERGLHFVSVDMDPHNTRMAAETFRAIDPGFEAVTAKGEDYLREREGPIDYVFLDAYDFDHGKHSELRQSRYEQFLGARIDDEACHRMHLDCARTLEGKLWLHGAVCVDDTWLEDGRWTAKGTLAMPFLLEHGFQIVEARNRAALLVRTPPPAG